MEAEASKVEAADEERGERENALRVNRRRRETEMELLELKKMEKVSDFSCDLAAVDPTIIAS